MEAIVDFVDGFINDTFMPIPIVKTKSTTAHRAITRSPEELAQMKKACESGAMPVGAYWYDGDCHWCKKGDKRMADGSCLGAGGHYMGGPRKRDLGGNVVGDWNIITEDVKNDVLKTTAYMVGVAKNNPNDQRVVAYFPPNVLDAVVRGAGKPPEMVSESDKRLMKSFLIQKMREKCQKKGGRWDTSKRNGQWGACVKKTATLPFTPPFMQHNAVVAPNTMVPTHVPQQKTPESCAKEGKVLTYGMRDGKVDDVVCATPEICAAHGGEWAFDGKVATCNVVTKKKEKEVPTIAIGLGALLLVGVAVVAIMGARK